MAWMQSPEIWQAMSVKPGKIEAAEKAPVFALPPSKPEPAPRPRVEPFNASEASRAEPVHSPPRLEITPREAEKF
jgi:hypothetical protein